MTQMSGIYTAEVTAGSLMLRESREIAKLLLKDATQQEWHRALVVENVLQKTAPSTAKRMARLLRDRLATMPREVWEMVVSAPNDMALQLLLACAIKHSRILGDFMLKVVRTHFQTYNLHLSQKDWKFYLEECRHIDGAVDTWSEITRKKMGQVVYRILAEAKYLDGTRTLKLQPVTILPEVRKLLEREKEKYILKAMDVTHE